MYHYQCPVPLQVAESPENVSQRSGKNSPRVAAFVVDESIHAAFVVDESIQYFILVEQTVLCQNCSLQCALFLTFSSYYVFHLEYPKPIRNVMFFFKTISYIQAHFVSQQPIWLQHQISKH